MTERERERGRQRERSKTGGRERVCVPMHESLSHGFKGFMAST